MFLEKSKFCLKCGQELKDGKCENCGLKSKFICTGKIFLTSVLTTLVVSSTTTFFVDRQIIKMQMKDAFKTAAENLGKTITGGNTEADEKNYVPTINDSKKFKGNCGISATAEIKNTSDFTYIPELFISIQNNTEKDIDALRFYAVFYDVYGEEIEDSMFLNKNLNSDIKIAAGSSENIKFDFLNHGSAKKIKLYLYSTYFADKTEWGDRKANKNTILKYGKEITVDSEFE